jgi:hypothetical protein
MLATAGAASGRTGALNKGRYAEIESVSCGSPGNCAAGGNYMERGGEQDQQAFVTVERNGRWGQALQVPGVALTKGQFYVTVSSVSCTPAGPCTAGGFYLGGPTGGFVVSEKNGRWGRAIAVPGLAARAGKQNAAQVFSVSCAAPGTCTAVGGDSAQQDFVTTDGH